MNGWQSKIRSVHMSWSKVDSYFYEAVNMVIKTGTFSLSNLPQNKYLM